MELVKFDHCSNPLIFGGSTLPPLELPPILKHSFPDQGSNLDRGKPKKDRWELGSCASFRDKRNIVALDSVALGDTLY